MSSETKGKIRYVEGCACVGIAWKKGVTSGLKILTALMSFVKKSVEGAAKYGRLIAF